MLKHFKASNGKTVEYSSLVYAVKVKDAEGETELALNIIHQHFDEVTFRNAFGHLDKSTYLAIQELVKSLGAKRGAYGRIDGTNHTLREMKDGSDKS